ncbi:hypothetical protein FKV70_16605 [Paenibacillus ottowii]|uniref:Uncharacterized protein n=1 Tax=Paenibacillus ottowii TaxID=2315729 RepID=A0ABY3B2Q1_9BACL|nr:hypothetical protein FKV70_16605 [Paenibacillus ottowii]
MAGIFLLKELQHHTPSEFIEVISMNHTYKVSKSNIELFAAKYIHQPENHLDQRSFNFLFFQQL